MDDVVIEAGLELDIIISRYLGFKIDEMTPATSPVILPPGHWWRITFPDGTFTEIFSETRLRYFVNFWSSSLVLAKTLRVECGGKLIAPRIWSPRKSLTVHYAKFETDGFIYQAESESMALAICGAWLSWKNYRG